MQVWSGKKSEVIGLYDINSNCVAKYAYDAYGNCTIIDSTNSDIATANAIRYRGYYYDDETGWYYLNARYYSPEWRRFISPDDTAYLDPKSVNGLNLYCYCGNDPINFVDPSGHELEWWGKILIGAAFILIGATVTFFTAGMGTVGLAAAGSALLATAKAVGISMAVSSGIGAISGAIRNGWEGALYGFTNGLVDGFMWGAIFAGTAQIFGAASKLLANRSVNFSKDFNLLYGNRNSPSTTLLRVNKSGKQLFRIDADTAHLWHFHFGNTPAKMRIHRTTVALMGYLGITNLINLWQ